MNSNLEGLKPDEIVDKALDEPICVKLKEWMLVHGDKIEKAFLSWIDNRLRFIIIRKEIIFDYEFETGLYSFEHSLYHDEKTKGIDVDFMCLPKCTMGQANPFLGSNYREIRN